MIGGSFVSVMALTTPFVAMHLRSSLPYMATPKHKVERALKFISARVSAARNNCKLSVHHTQQQQQLHTLNENNNLNFVDLGSGDGSTILAASSLGWNASGLELNPTLWFVSSIRRLFSPNSIRSRSQFILGDMFENRMAKLHLQQANCVMIFGVKSLMPQIATLIQQCDVSALGQFIDTPHKSFKIPQRLTRNRANRAMKNT